ncbi:hypothetical protein DICVIV_08380 [Dictyocaulus viviparus]|uniref:Ubiquitin thioesterase n=1 Tax=Dictyocaulus viviparus TaxID=29172 RepID=A0A0D8XT63_DICVI|nr:hypothetical protein DICVIV_08380 [Dictyocaulus viviparus]
MTGVETASNAESSNVDSNVRNSLNEAEDLARRTHEDVLRENELTEEQLKQIEQEQKKTPLVGDRVPFEVVVMEYDPVESFEYYTKAKDLLETYSDIRIIRRDGNCFYRAVLVAQIEIMLKDPDECIRFEKVCKGWQDRLIKLGYPDFTTTDFCEVFYKWMDPIWSRQVNPKTIFQDLNDDNEANYLIIFLRLITAGYLKENSEQYAPFIEDITLSEYCASEIESMWKDADHLAVTGLVNAIGQSIRVQYMDQNAAPNGGLYYDFPPDQAEVPRISLLYRPGHYDLIYRR